MRKRLYGVIISAMCVFCTLPSVYAQNIPIPKGINGLRFAVRISGEMPKGMKCTIVLILFVTAAAVLFYCKGKRK